MISYNTYRTLGQPDFCYLDADLTFELGVFQDGTIKAVETPSFIAKSTVNRGITEFPESQLRNWTNLLFQEAITEVYCTIAHPPPK